MTRKTRNTPPGGESPHTPLNPGSLSSSASQDEPTLLEEAAPVTPSPHLLSPAHQRFCQEYLLDLNSTHAYLRSHPKASLESAQANAYRLMANDGIRREIRRLMDERAVIAGVSADRVLFKYIEQAMVDPRELVEVKVGSCRHCWGLYHQHQYTDAEYEKAEADHVHAEAKKRKLAERQGTPFEPAPFHGKGGPGWSPNRTPNPDCPECHGDGRPRSILKDMQNASPGALALFGGVKYDKAGNMAVMFTDSRQNALKAIAEHLGMFNGDRKPLTADPLQDLLEEIRGAHGAGSTLPIAHDDPERRQATDVTPKVSDRKPEPGSGLSRPKKQWKASK